MVIWKSLKVCSRTDSSVNRSVLAELSVGIVMQTFISSLFGAKAYYIYRVIQR